MKTILMFPYAHHLGGTQPLIAIGEALRAAGHRVVFAGRGQCMRFVEAAGFDAEDLIELDSSRAVAHFNRSNLDYHTPESVAAFVDAECALIGRIAPDAVVDLHRPTLGLSARLMRTPRAVLCNTVLTRYYRGERLLPESHPLAAWVRPLPQHWLRPFSHWAERQLFRAWARPYNAFLRARGQAPIGSLQDLFEGDATILMDARELMPMDGLPDHVHAVGPLLHESAAALPATIGPAAGRRTLFVYLGSYGEQFSRVVGYLARLFGGRDGYRVVAATGGLYRYAGAPLPGNVVVTDYVPASAVLADGCAAMVTHGGRGSIYSALGHGVPLIGLPNQGEQEWNLAAIERLGLGRRLSTRHDGYTAFAEAVSAVIDDAGYRERAARFAQLLAGYDGAATAARVVAAL